MLRAPRDPLAGFVDPRLRVSELDFYVPRRAILTAIEDTMPLFRGQLLDVGCGIMPYRDFILSRAGTVTEYTGLDLPGTRHPTGPVLEWDGGAIPLPASSVDCVMATEVFKHCPDLSAVLTEIRRVLRRDGFLFFTVPFVWPLHLCPDDQYRYTPFSLARHLDVAGFKHSEILAMGGWDAALAQVLGLWARRRPLPRLARCVVSLLVLPMVRALAGRDNAAVDFMRDPLVSGFKGWAADSAAVLAPMHKGESTA